MPRPLCFYRSAFWEAAILIEATQLIDSGAMSSGDKSLNNAYFYLNYSAAIAGLGKQCRKPL
jgi:hypothetical protein